MKQIMSIAIGTIILLLGLSSFKPVINTEVVEANITVGEPIINTPADVAQYIKELNDGQISISTEQVL